MCGRAVSLLYVESNLGEFCLVCGSSSKLSVAHVRRIAQMLPGLPLGLHCCFYARSSFWGWVVKMQRFSLANEAC